MALGSLQGVSALGACGWLARTAPGPWAVVATLLGRTAAGVLPGWRVLRGHGPWCPTPPPPHHGVLGCLARSPTPSWEAHSLWRPYHAGGVVTLPHGGACRRWREPAGCAATRASRRATVPGVRGAPARPGWLGTRGGRRWGGGRCRGRSRWRPRPGGDSPEHGWGRRPVGARWTAREPAARWASPAGRGLRTPEPPAVTGGQKASACGWGLAQGASRPHAGARQALTNKD